ncbi:MAG: flagellar basal body-associated protein FliL [Gammaproteobacteria bacterium]|nr:flagellar basal body-associated protein FliL [Gammaproteobacteria bacterium]MBK82125.1 flagellar basal body-associated protein FliL [Gammaproteobacteria bacterium]|tara:strand:+ start:6109 stop:6573 length:465 start_codon:yes stop_codon:yes gene_type:complete
MSRMIVSRNRAAWKAAIVALAAWLAAAGALAQEAEAGDGEAAADPDEVRYVPLQPSFVTNFGDAGNGRLKFVKADVSVRVSSSDAAAAARYHLPALRNAIVLLLSRQDESTIATGTGREAIRAEALAELRGILEAEEGEPFIEDVLFTNFIVQR